jgi:four helix bundle protein
MERKGSELESRLINFSVSVLDLTDEFPKTYAGNYYANQLTRSGSSPAMQYGEAQAAESRKDFIHKMKCGLKELRETFINLRIVRKKGWINDVKIELVLTENNELISIFVKSISTAESRISKSN